MVQYSATRGRAWSGKYFTAKGRLDNSSQDPNIKAKLKQLVEAHIQQGDKQDTEVNAPEDPGNMAWLQSQKRNSSQGSVGWRTPTERSAENTTQESRKFREEIRGPQKRVKEGKDSSQEIDMDAGVDNGLQPEEQPCPSPSPNYCSSASRPTVPAPGLVNQQENYERMEESPVQLQDPTKGLHTRDPEPIRIFPDLGRPSSY